MARRSSPADRRVRAVAFTLALLAFPTVLAAAGGHDEALTAPASIQFSVLESQEGRTVVQVLLPDLDLGRREAGGRMFDVATMAGVLSYGDVGEPLVGVAGTLLALPGTGTPSLRVLEASYETRAGLSLIPVQPSEQPAGEPLALDAAAYGTREFLPRETVTLGEPAIMRDLRVAPVRVYPIQYNPASGEVRALRRLVIEVTCSGSGGVNELPEQRLISRSFEPLYESLVLNYDSVRTRGYETDGRGTYIIVTADAYYSNILPLAEWKHKSGLEVEVAKLSVIGSSASAIKTYLQTAYNTWNPRPSFVLLVGDAEQLPAGSGSSDDYYATLSGSDYLVDVNLGRLSCDNTTQCDLLVAKTLGYERTPYMTDTTWFKKGCLIVREDYDPVDDPYYFGDTWFAYNLMQAEGFTQIDTLFRRNSSTYTNVHNAVTNGRVIVNYRGQGVSNWWSPFDCDPSQTNPGYKLPVVVSATCGTGNFYSYDTYPCESWMRAGSVAAPRGAVGFLATSAIVSGHADYRSVVDRGIFDALFNLKIRELSGALNFGKLRFYTTFGVQSEYQGWNCQGDPSLDIWTDTPKTLVVTHPATVPMGPSDLLIEVDSGGSPLTGARVCAYSANGVYAWGATNAQGEVTLSINPTGAGALSITVTGHNMHPYEGSAQVIVAGPYLAYVGNTVDDSGSGDGDGVLEPGETARVTVTLRNDGTASLEETVGALSASDPYVVVTDDDGAYGTIASGGGTGSCTANAYRVSVSPAAPPAHQVAFSLAVSGDEATRYSQGLAFSITLGGAAVTGPCGPDAYGYYAYDAGDVWTGQAPVYGWVELVGTGSLITAITNNDAAITTLTLPFTFKYYGTNYTQVSACSNGFISMGVEDYRFGDNSGIPDVAGPDAMVAPMWDDLSPNLSGDIYQWNDTANHRFIIQYDAVPHFGGANPETFEVIWLDPAYYPTASGNGIILFQYQVAAAPGTATIGIENPVQTYGVQYQYNGSYDAAAAPIMAGSVIKFTTDPPSQAPVWLAVSGQAVDDPPPGGDGDGKAEPIETVNVVLTVDNNGSATASAVTGTLSTSDPDVTIVDGSASFGDVPGGGSASNSGSPFVVTIAADPADDLVEFQLTLATGSRYATSDVITITLDLSQTGVDDPLVFSLRQNAPNPFGGGTAIAFDLPGPARTSLSVYTVGGRKITTLVDQDLPAGRHAVAWDGRDASGHEVAAGVYLYRLEAGDRVGVRKMLVIR
jgi:hypothetical protein